MMTKKETLGELEAMVLLAALRLGEEAYGLSIAEEISRTAGRDTGRASVYVTLRRLEKQGLITTRRETPQEAAGSKPRRLVRVGPEAVALVRESRRALQRMWSGLEDLLEEA
jgi:DNA-binding PadR family transcriptional regulator